MGERDAGELLRGVGKDADLDAAGVQAAQLLGNIRVAAQVNGRPLLREALEQRPPVRQLLVEGADVDAVPARGVLEPVSPERFRVAERAELDGDRLHRGRRRSHSSIPSATPTASMPTSIGEACRPRTKCWWSSSVDA